MPRGWRIEVRVDGAVDDDARPDAVLVLRDADPANIVTNDGVGVPTLDTNPRLLVVLRAEPGGWRRIAMTDRLIRRNDTPTLSDPFENGELSLDRRVLAVTVGFFANAGSWTTSQTTYRFRWQGGCMRLIGYDESALNRGSGETTDTSVNLLTRAAVRRTGRMESDDTVDRRYTLTPRAPVCLETVDEGFDPRVPDA